MRGVVTLAAAQSLPQNTPYRSQLILIAYTVAVVTILVQGGTLPALVRFVGVPGTDTGKSQRELAELLQATHEAGLAVLEDRSALVPDAGAIDSELIREVTRSSLIRSELEWERLHQSDTEPITQTRHEICRALRLAVVGAERECLLDARARGAYPSMSSCRCRRFLI